jgi:hypothetical protein
MAFIDVTDEVSKLNKFTDIKLQQLLNILCIFTTLAVLKLLKSNDINELHSLNIELIFVTDEVSKNDKSKVFSFEQP